MNLCDKYGNIKATKSNKKFGKSEGKEKESCVFYSKLLDYLPQRVEK